MIAAMSSGSGKTILTAALAAFYKNQKKRVSVLKCGPDYLDPIFHNRVLSEEEKGGKNIDLFLQGRKKAVRIFKDLTEGADIALVEGVMGFYDGISGTSENSAWDIAEILGLPVILAVKPSGVSVTLAAAIKGLMTFRQSSHIIGIILTDCKSSTYAYLKPILESETGLTVFGYLPHFEAAEIQSRHLGLAAVASGEIQEIQEKFSAIAEKLPDTIDLDGIYETAEDSGDRAGRDSFFSGQSRVKIAVAYDDAFCFYYRTSLEALRKAGAELCFFSPLSDSRLPEDISGLYLGGGYPELFLRELRDNRSIRDSILEVLSGGLPFIAECGGFMYLHKSITPVKNMNGDDVRAESFEEHRYEMVGYLDGDCYNTGKLNRFGYLKFKNDGADEKKSTLFNSDEFIPAHEFHYYESTAPGVDLLAVKERLGRSGTSSALAAKDYVSDQGNRTYRMEWRFGYTGDGYYAGFPHIDLGGEIPVAEKFVEAALLYRDRNLS